MLTTELFLSPRAAKMSIYKSALPVSSFFTLQKEVLPIASPEAASSPYDGQRSVAQPSRLVPPQPCAKADGVAWSTLF